MLDVYALSVFVFLVVAMSLMIGSLNSQSWFYDLRTLEIQADLYSLVFTPQISDKSVVFILHLPNNVLSLILHTNQP